MKKCPNCGEQNPDSFSICEKCNAMLDLKKSSSNYSYVGGNDENKFEKIVSVHLRTIEDELRAQADDLNTIKKCALFFTILTIINLLGSLFVTLGILGMVNRIL